MKTPLVSIITVNYNQSEVTRQLLSSLRKISYQNIEILVIDNGSQNDTPEKLKDDFPEIILIISQENLGFAGGNNLGVDKAKGEYCLFINNDTEVEPDFLEPLISRMQSDESIGMLSPKIRFHHTPDTIQYAGYTRYHPITMRQQLIGYREKDVGQHDAGGYTFAVHGAAMMVPMKIIDQIGSMDEIFFLYYEEHDWCERVKKAGYKMYYESNSIVWHKESISTGRESPLKAYYITRNRILFTRRNSKAGLKWISLIYLYLLVPVKFSLKYLAKKQIPLLRASWKGTLWNLSHKAYNKNHK